MNPNKRYVIAVAPSEEFMGPLSGSYIQRFKGDLSGFLEGLKPKDRSEFMRDTPHTSRSKFPPILDTSYVSNPHDAMSFDSSAKAHLFTIYLRSFFPDDSLDAKFCVEELTQVGSERHLVNALKILE